MKQPDTYIIYGANSQIGSHLAKLMQPKVKHLVLFYHKNTNRIAPLLQHQNVIAHSSNIEAFDDLAQTLKQTLNNILPKDVAAVYFPAIRSTDAKPIIETDLTLANNIININLLGAIHFLKAVLYINAGLPVNKEAKSIRIVMLGSDVSRKGLENGAVYAATKAAVANLVLSVAKEAGEDGALINIVSPGPVESEDKDQKFSPHYSAFRKRYFQEQREKSCLYKLATPDDVCNAICFLTSLQNTHITGEEIFVNGGGR